MADFDWAGLIQQGLGAATGYVQQNMALKQAKKLAKIQASGASGMAFPMLGTGNMRFAPSGGGFMPAAYQMPYSGGGGGSMGGGGMMQSLGDAIGLGPVLDPLVNYFTAPGGGRRGVTYECYTTPSGRSAVTGTRSLGRPMLWSGDLSAVRRVARVRRKLGAGRRFR